MSSHRHIVAPDKLVQIVRPFVGTFRSVHRGDSAIDVLHMTDSIDADVRHVDAAGLELVRDGFDRFVSWSEVRSITVRGIADGRTTSTVVWENAAARWPVHSNRSIAA